jgi:3-isopropylmalate dehydrogenase
VCVAATVPRGGRFHVERQPEKRQQARDEEEQLNLTEAPSGKHPISARVAVIPGDGIGPEVVGEALKVARAAGADLGTVMFELGAKHYLASGEVLPDDVLRQLKGFDAIFLGAVGSPEVPPGVLERGLLLRLRFDLDLYINLRPFQAQSSVGAGVPLDFAVVRENTEGTYAGEGGFLRKGTQAEVATQGSVNTRFGVERCIRFAFELAESRRRHLTLVHKTNVLNYSGDLWQRTFNEVATDHPDVETSYNHVDAACMYMVGSPQRYDVIVTDNLFGDIITDLAGAVAGGIGRAASANLNPARTGPSLFEPVHGSAPDIAGTGKADPTAAIISMAMMLDYLGLADQAARINKAVQGFQPAGPLSTSQYGDEISERV